jgi:hypothetical protein
MRISFTFSINYLDDKSRRLYIAKCKRACPAKGRSRVSTLHRPREPQAAAARFAVARQIARGDYWYLPQIRVPHQKAR